MAFISFSSALSSLSESKEGSFRTSRKRETSVGEKNLLSQNLRLKLLEGF
jgi:hypothetical protein